MATPLTDSINALTTYANEVTGASDTTLSDAVYTLAQGYGQGGLTPIYTSTVTSNPTNTSGVQELIEGIFTDWQASHVYVVIFPNNASTSIYAGIAVCVGCARNLSRMYLFSRVENTTNTSNTSWLFDVTVGTTINIYDVTP